MKKYLALAAAGGALAIGVPAALAATDAPENTTRNVPVQDATPTPDSQQQRPDREDCPEKDGSGGNSSSVNEI
jgi:hypothetical protein